MENRSDNLEDVSVILPTFNANGQLLERHIEGLNRWVSQAKEVVVVDSQSNDGTPEYIRKHLRHSDLKFFNRPRGLYQAWNFAVEQAESKYVYFATVGDVIDPHGVASLLDSAQKHNADVVISPPRFLDEGLKVIEKKYWPVSWCSAALPTTRPILLLPDLVAAIHLLFFPSTLAGSSASNLYRRQKLLDRPFPYNFGNQGDSGWALLSTVDLRWTIHPKPVADFITHEKAGTTDRRLITARNDLLETMLRLLEEEAAWAEAIEKAGLRSFSSVLSAEEALRKHWKELRFASWPWQLTAEGWSLRAKRTSLKKQRNRLKKDRLRDLRSNLAGRPDSLR